MTIYDTCFTHQRTLLSRLCILRPVLLYWVQFKVCEVEAIPESVIRCSVVAETYPSLFGILRPSKTEVIIIPKDNISPQLIGGLHLSLESSRGAMQ